MQDGTDPADAAAAPVNPLTALGMIETMKTEGHTAPGFTPLVHQTSARYSTAPAGLTASAWSTSFARRNMLTSSAKQEPTLCATPPTPFHNDLEDALRSTGATIAFDAIGGGELADTLLSAMERGGRRAADAVQPLWLRRHTSRSTSTVVLTAARRRCPAATACRGRSAAGCSRRSFKISARRLWIVSAPVADEITTTFAGSYGMVLSLEDAVDPEMVKRYAKMATGDKALVTPQA